MNTSVLRLACVLGALMAAAAQPGVMTQSPTLANANAPVPTPVPTPATPTRLPTTALPVPAVISATPLNTPTPPVPTTRPPTNFPTYQTGFANTWGPITALSMSAMSVNVPPMNVRMQAYKAEEEERQRLTAIFGGERSLLDDVSHVATAKASKRDEVAEFAETSSVHVPSQRKLQTPQTNLPTSGAMLSSSPYMSFWNSYSFNGLGNPANRPPQQRFYLSVRIEDSGFGGEKDPPRVPMPGVKHEAVRVWLVAPNNVNGFRLLKSCFPKVRHPSTSPECAKPKMIDCVVNEDVTGDIMNGQGGTLQIVFASEGFTSNTCTQIAGITAEYTLSSYHANPTPAPIDHTPHGNHHGHGHAPSAHASSAEEDTGGEGEKGDGDHETPNEVDDDKGYGDDYHELEEEHYAAMDTVEVDGNGTPLFGISMAVGGFLYLLMGLRILIIRQRYWESGITPINGAVVVFYFTLLGIQFALELTLGSILIHADWWVEMGLGIILSRMACWLASFYTLGTIYQSGYYTKLLNEQQLNDNMISFMIFNFFVLSDTQLLSYFPWNSTLFTKLNYGLPDVERIRIAIWPKFIQMLVSIICTALFIDHLMRTIHHLEHNFAHHEEEHYYYMNEGEDDEPSGDDDARRFLRRLSRRLLTNHVTHNVDCAPHSDDHYSAEAHGYSPEGSGHHEHDDDDWNFHDNCMYHAEFMHDLDVLYVWSAVTLAFSVVVMTTLFYTVLKHLSMVPVLGTWSSDLYDRNVREEMASAETEAERGNKFLERNIELPHGRLSLGGGHLGAPPFGGLPPPINPMHGSPGIMGPDGRRMSMQQAMNEQSFRGRPSLDGRRSSLGAPVDRRPSFDGRMPPPGGRPGY